MLPKNNVNFGHSSRLGYDTDYYEDYVQDSVSPLSYRLSPVSISNCNACTSVFGPRSSGRSGVSTVNKSQSVAPALDLTDLESILSNRNMLNSKSRDGQMNDIDVMQFQLQHARTCNDFLDPIATHLTNPPDNYRCMSINRFHDLPKNPQANIFYDFAINTQLEARDNYYERIPRLARYDPTLPPVKSGMTQPCRYGCGTGCPHQK